MSHCPKVRSLIFCEDIGPRTIHNKLITHLIGHASCLVTVHVVSTRYPGQCRLVSHMIGTHEDSLGPVTSRVGTYATRSAGV